MSSSTCLFGFSLKYFFQPQKGFLKGRYIGECTRLVCDLIDKLEEDDIPGLLLLIDFEKAFDTVEWSFIEKTLQFYGFGPSLQKWIKAFYCDISSAVTNNGHVSEFFSPHIMSLLGVSFSEMQYTL